MDVVAAALVQDGRVLAARRMRPEQGWEFPGGKVEPGELPEHAIERECAEELGAQVQARRLLAVAHGGRIVLQLWEVGLVAGVPVALDDHDELRWVARDELPKLDWLPIDRDLLPVVADLLA